MNTLVIEKLISNGHGLARLADGRVVFVPGTLPGEKVRCLRLERRRGTIWATSVERLTDAPAREEPTCVHDHVCGGCRLLHIRREREALYKASYLADVIHRIAKLDHPFIQMMDFPWQQSRIRAKFHIRHGQLGFHAPDSNRITDIAECAVLPRALNDLLPRLRERAKETEFDGVLFAATDAAGRSPVLTWQPNKNKGKKETSVDRLHVQWAAGTTLLAETGKTIGTVGESTVHFDWLGHNVALTPQNFFQSNPNSWPMFWSWVRHFQGRYRPSSVWDVHAGAGFLSSALSPLQLWLTEPNRAAAQQARNLALRGFSSLHVIRDTAESAIFRGMIPNHLDAAVLDPPRSGCEKALRTYLIEKGPPAMLYISCDMGSFARDLRELATAYQLDSPVYAANLNPGTLGLETAVYLVRKAR